MLPQRASAKSDALPSTTVASTCSSWAGEPVAVPAPVALAAHSMDTFNPRQPRYLRTHARAVVVFVDRPTTEAAGGGDETHSDSVFIVGGSLCVFWFGTRRSDEGVWRVCVRGSSCGRERDTCLLSDTCRHVSRHHGSLARARASTHTCIAGRDHAPTPARTHARTVANIRGPRRGALVATRPPTEAPLVRDLALG